MLPLARREGTTLLIANNVHPLFLCSSFFWGGDEIEFITWNEQKLLRHHGTRFAGDVMTHLSGVFYIFGMAMKQ